MEEKGALKNVYIQLRCGGGFNLSNTTNQPTNQPASARYNMAGHYPGFSIYPITYNLVIWKIE